jgi:hypothetical protein
MEAAATVAAPAEGDPCGHDERECTRPKAMKPSWRRRARLAKQDPKAVADMIKDWVGGRR